MGHKEVWKGRGSCLGNERDLSGDCWPREDERSDELLANHSGDGSRGSLGMATGPRNDASEEMAMMPSPCPPLVLSELRRVGITLGAEGGEKTPRCMMGTG